MTERQKPARARRGPGRVVPSPGPENDASAGDEALEERRRARRRERAALVAYDVGERILAGEHQPRPAGTVLRLDLDDAERLGLVERSSADLKLLGPVVAPSSSTPPPMPKRVRGRFGWVNVDSIGAAHDWDERLWT